MVRVFVVLCEREVEGLKTMKTAIIFDCEFLCIEGSQRRFWCGADDPDPVVAQIGAVKLSLQDGFDILQTTKIYVKPKDRFGEAIKISPFLAQLTKITQAQIDSEGVGLAKALIQLDEFSSGSAFWSWGKDELNLLGIGCFVEGIAPPIPAHRFANAVNLFVAAQMPMEDIVRTPSNKLAEYFEISHPTLCAHDGLDDALSVAYSLQFLLLEGRLKTLEFQRSTMPNS